MAKGGKGRVVASYLVRVTLHERPGHPIAEWAAGGGGEGDDRVGLDRSEHPEPTIERMEDLVRHVMYEGTPYFSLEQIGVSAERVDR